MTKAELIEALVHAMVSAQGLNMAWLAQNQNSFSMIRRDAEACVPVFVTCAENWLTHNAEEYEDSADGSYGEVLARAWRKEMA